MLVAADRTWCNRGAIASSHPIADRTWCHRGAIASSHPSEFSHFSSTPYRRLDTTSGLGLHNHFQQSRAALPLSHRPQKQSLASGRLDGERPVAPEHPDHASTRQHCAPSKGMTFGSSVQVGHQAVSSARECSYDPSSTDGRNILLRKSQLPESASNPDTFCKAASSSATLKAEEPAAASEEALPEVSKAQFQDGNELDDDGVSHAYRCLEAITVAKSAAKQRILWMEPFETSMALSFGLEVTHRCHEGHYDLVMAPVNDQNSGHWSLLVWDTRDRQVFHIDSLHSKNSGLAAQLAQVLTKDCKAQIFNTPCSQQPEASLICNAAEDRNLCGLYMATFAVMVASDFCTVCAQGQPWSFRNQESKLGLSSIMAGHMKQLRKKLHDAL